MVGNSSVAAIALSVLALHHRAAVAVVVGDGKTNADRRRSSSRRTKNLRDRRREDGAAGLFKHNNEMPPGKKKTTTTRRRGLARRMETDSSSSSSSSSSYWGDEPSRERRPSPSSAAAMEMEVEDGLTSITDGSAASQRTRRQLSCENNLGFHPDVVNEKGCSNSDNYPPPWEREGLKNKMFYKTAKECCDFFFTKAGEDCPVEDVCGGGSSSSPPPAPAPPSPAQNGASPMLPPPALGPDTPPASTSSCRWHIDVSAGKNGKAEGCTDDNTYPPEWIGNQMMFHATAEECCSKLFGSRPCANYPRGCEGQPVPQLPTKWPTPPPVKATERPTARPTRKPTTQTPTRDPTPRPTYSPTKTPVLYYIDDLTGMCVSNYEKSKPEWIKAEYPIYSQCCAKSRDPKTCMKASPDRTGQDLSPGKTLSPTASPPALWYADPSTGICVNDFEFPVPGWFRGGTYEDYRRCCLLDSKDLDKCLKMDPALASSGAGTDSSGGSSTDVAPIPEYYLQESTAVCVNLHEAPMTYQTKTFEDYDECCATSWDEQRCLDEKPTWSPTANPTLSPSTPWPTDFAICPDPYDESGSTTYRRGDEVEVNLVVYRCRRPPYATYCNRADFRPPEEDPGPEEVAKEEEENDDKGNVNVIPTAKIENSSGSELWRDAWERLYRCVHAPTSSPTATPTTPSPTCKTRWHPGGTEKQRTCTNSDVYPALWNVEPLLSTYFVDTAEECCEKFYGGGKCRIRDTC